MLKESSFQFNGKHYLQTLGTTMGTKAAVARIYCEVVINSTYDQNIEINL